MQQNDCIAALFKSLRPSVGNTPFVTNPETTTIINMHLASFLHTARDSNRKERESIRFHSPNKKSITAAVASSSIVATITTIAIGITTSQNE